MNTRTPGTEKIQERVGQCVFGGGGCEEQVEKMHRASEYKAKKKKRQCQISKSQTTTDGQAASATRESMGLAMAEWTVVGSVLGGGRGVRPATLQGD